MRTSEDVEVDDFHFCCPPCELDCEMNLSGKKRSERESPLPYMTPAATAPILMRSSKHSDRNPNVGIWNWVRVSTDHGQHPTHPNPIEQRACRHV